MLQYVIAGLALGGIYAICSAGIVITYVSSGVLNFAFGAMAFFVARFYYYLHIQHSWSIVGAAILSIGVAAPLLGVVLYFGLFRFLRLSPVLIKIVATLGLSVALPAVATLIFGNQSILKAPGLAPEPVKVFKFLGTPVTLDQIIVYISVAATVVVGAIVLRRTDIGLKTRAMVDSPAMTALSGTNPERVSVGVWAVSTFFAGLAGVLAAPIIGLEQANFTLLIAAAFAAVIAAKLRSLPIAVGVGLLMGIVTAIVQRYLPPSSTLTADIIPSIPFAFIAVFLVYRLIRSGRINESEGVGGALDRATTPQGESQLAATARGPGSKPTTFVGRNAGPLVILAIVALLPAILQGFWVGVIAQGIAYGLIYLSFTIVTGQGGMIWLCMITFAGMGALTTAQLATNHGWPILAAIVAGGLIVVPVGVLIGILTIRLGNLYVALVTLTFALLVENLVFPIALFANSGLGVNVPQPGFASSPRAFAYFALVVFCLVSLVIVNLRRSTTGLALDAVRWSEPASRTLGVNVVQVKVITAGLAAFVAGVGGGVLASQQISALPGNFATFLGVIWLAVLVTLGIRSNVAALVAGVTYTVLPALSQSYLPTWTNQIPPVLFGLGAITVAKYPEGTLAMQGEQIRRAVYRLRGQASTDSSLPPPPPPLAVETGADGVASTPKAAAGVTPMMPK